MAFQLDFDLKREFTDFGLYCGLGGMAMGTARCMVRMGGYTGRFRCLGGIDVNPKACRNFGKLVGVDATCMDLFDEEQYEDWHGKKPPENWKAMGPADILAAAGGEYPDLVELSAPCKGLSGLLSGEKSKSKKYQALNKLTVRGVFLTLEAFKKDLPGVIFFENVPRIQTRGADLLATMKGMLESYGYAVHMGVHNAGKLYGGGQNRIRFFLIARNIAKVPKLIYKPRELPLKSIGDVLSQLPWPGDIERGGSMHQLPKISDTTAARLACIRPGKDWRDLQGDLSSIRLAHDPRHGAWLVSRWSDPINAITGAKGIGVSNSPNAVAQPIENIHRSGGLGENFAGAPGLMGVIPYASSSPTISGGAACTSSNTPAAVQDLGIRLGYEPRGGGPFGVNPWDKEGPTVLGNSSVRGSNVSAVQDIGIQGGDGRHTNHLAITPWEAPGRTATGATHVGNGGQSVQDKSISLPDNPGRHASKYRVQDPNSPALTVTTSDRVGSGAACMSDMRISDSPNRHTTKYMVQDPDRPAATVTADTDIQTGAPSVAERRIVLDPASPKFNHAYHMTPWGEASPTVASGTAPRCGAISVQDMGINAEQLDDTLAPSLTWYLPVVQPGFPYYFTEDSPGEWSWHRPLTTLDLAALQDLMPELIRAGGGVPLALEGSDKERREQIGNAVPPGAMCYIGTVILYSLMKGRLQDETVASDEVWVREEEFLDFTGWADELMDIAS